MTESYLPESAVAAPAAEHGRINCMWRRIFALIVDGLILGIIGLVLGLCCGSWFSTLGPWGRLVGFAITLGYFGLLNSAIGRGRTAGKLLLGIRVVTAAGIPPSLLRSCLRAAILFTPYFLNNLQVPARLMMNPWYSYMIGTIVLGGLGTTIYLALFNCITRQSLHDLLCGTFVVRAKGTPDIPVLRPWRGHYVIIGIIMLVLLAGSAAVGYYLNKNLPMRELTNVALALDKTGSYWSAAAFRGTTWMSNNSSTTTRQVLQINVLIKKKPRNNTAEAARIARIALKAYPAARNLDAVTITITHGYDIGIWSMWQAKGESKPPADWDESDEN